MKSSKPAGASKVFLFSAANAITAFSCEADARRALGEGDLLFASPDELKQITAAWPGGRLVQLWNRRRPDQEVYRPADRAHADLGRRPGN